MIKKRNLFEIFNAVNKTDIAPPKPEIKKVAIDEMTMQRLFNKHMTNGLIIISGNRHSNTHEQNNKAYVDLKIKVKSAGFSFVPVYGGFVETDKNGDYTEQVMEASLIVFNYKIASSNRHDENGDALKRLGMDLCVEFNQDSFLFSPPDSNLSMYITREGSVTDTFTDLTINDLTLKYFTSLNRTKDLTKSNKVFTFTNEKYLNESPSSVGAAAVRYGEVFFNTK